MIDMLDLIDFLIPVPILSCGLDSVQQWSPLLEAPSKTNAKYMMLLGIVQKGKERTRPQLGVKIGVILSQAKVASTIHVVGWLKS